MTEDKWLGCRTSRVMFEFLAGRTPARKLLLIGCGCYHLANGKIPLPQLQSVLAVAESVADGVASEVDVNKAYEIANHARDFSTGSLPDIPSEYQSVNGWCSAWAAHALIAEFLDSPRASSSFFALSPDIEVDRVHKAVVDVIDYLSGIDAQYSANRRRQAAIIRCIVGNPFRPVAFASGWRSPTAVALADAIYADRAFDRLPILADALEEAGCDHPDVLAHCRGPGPHARGCWVVDMVLGKA